MADFFADNMVKKCIGEIIIHKDTIKDDTAVWKSLTRLMFRNYPAHEVFNFVHKALEETSDEQWFENKYPRGFFKETFEYPKRKSTVIKKKLMKGKIKKLIDDNISIIDVAKSYGLEIKNDKCLCPFHDEENASLVFYPKTNSFFCFGCRKGGDVIEFVRRIER